MSVRLQREPDNCGTQAQSLEFTAHKVSEQNRQRMAIRTTLTPDVAARAPGSQEIEEFSLYHRKIAQSCCGRRISARRANELRNQMLMKMIAAEFEIREIE